MTAHAAEISPQTYARIGGVLYLIIIVAGGFAEGVVRSRLIVAGDAAATAKNIMASEWTWRIAFAGDLAIYACAVPLVLIFYVLLSPVNRNLALLAVFFNLVSIAIEGVNALSHFAPLLILNGADYLKVFDQHQLQALALLFVNLHAYGFAISLTIFSFVLLLEGYLIFNSGYFPKTLGVFVAIAAICYLTNSFALFLAPVFQAKIFPTILIPSFIGELSLCLWLLVMGVNVPKWEDKAKRLAG
ncbi:MAG TPA: DUF4386 domain-containing protein [Sporolactobacillaceae bacterium]|nr:DUF4386 domain-containing protein [Sporolactobacillaceae bacterium]